MWIVGMTMSDMEENKADKGDATWAPMIKPRGVGVLLRRLHLNKDLKEVSESLGWLGKSLPGRRKSKDRVNTMPGMCKKQQ